MSAIGWNVYPHDIHIVGNTTDVLGYGSLYSEHTFYAEMLLVSVLKVIGFIRYTIIILTHM